jgi:hypothetical protein
MPTNPPKITTTSITRGAIKTSISLGSNADERWVSVGYALNLGCLIRIKRQIKGKLCRELEVVARVHLHMDVGRVGNQPRFTVPSLRKGREREHGTRDIQRVNGAVHARPIVCHHAPALPFRLAFAIREFLQIGRRNVNLNLHWTRVRLHGQIKITADIRVVLNRIIGNGDRFYESLKHPKLPFFQE